MNKKRTRWLSLLLIVLTVTALFTGCAGSESKAPEADGFSGRPAMWEVTAPDSGNTIYLFGSIHAGEEELYPLDQDIMDAFYSCDFLAVEVDILAFLEEPEKAMDLAAYMLYMDGGTITDEIDEELFDKILDVIEAEGIHLGISREYAATFRSYMFISLLSDAAITRAGLSSEHGVDMYFLQLAREREIEILEVESIESQLAMFQGFSPELQSYLLEQALELDAAGQEIQQLYAVWKSGEIEAWVETEQAVEAEEAEMDEIEQRVTEEYNEALLTDRNAGMADVAEEYLVDGKRVFYVVGALHMVGDDGIVQHLTDRGYQVRRV